jgi:hypothetical protein
MKPLDLKERLGNRFDEFCSDVGKDPEKPKVPKTRLAEIYGVNVKTIYSWLVWLKENQS